MEVDVTAMENTIKQKLQASADRIVQLRQKLEEFEQVHQQLLGQYSLIKGLKPVEEKKDETNAN